MDADELEVDRQIELCFARKKAQQFAGFLRVLREACEYAADLGCSHWDFAIDLPSALTMNLQINDLRWMIGRGWIQCMSSDNQTQCSTLITSIDSKARFVLGQLGLSALRFAENENSGDMLAIDQLQDKIRKLPKPFWDAERHELVFCGQLVKRYRSPATNQETILAAFEEEDWPPRIDDPLPMVSHIEPKRRLSDSIKCLNRNQRESLIRFRGDGTGEGILWDVSGGNSIARTTPATLSRSVSANPA